MAVTAFLCLLVGIFLGLNFRAFAVAPMTLAIATGIGFLAAAGGSVFDTLLAMLTAVLGLQFGYLLGVTARGILSAASARDGDRTASAPAQPTH